MPRRPRVGATAPTPATPDDPVALLAQVRTLLAETQALSGRIAAVNEVAVAINNSTTIEDLLPVVATQAKWILDFDYCGLALVEPLSIHLTLHDLFGTLARPAAMEISSREGI